ncbi:DNA cytosine methyltransferase [Rhizobium rhizoryzae]|uniref:Cytosine-specific methyltransferase n=1 Tax=Rhizobium rhizoryzae TaxID=451876 RepID=A0A7W6LFH4_9HYPH|nr:DNA cytosine methyltransferase [Rhizobium rhizoryzae]MBB4143237.1 DNA (cytosine-5)-methyltransferase 1 [Rhizobium rhizoryzae]
MRVVELFCGAGGMSLGLKKAGLRVVGAFDVMPDAVATYRANVGDHVHEVDLTDVLSIIPRIRELGPDLITGGPPCQDYSIAGRREEGLNARLTLAFALTIVSVRPQWFLMENVVQAAGSQNWAEAKAILKAAGYGISESRLNFAHYGVAQARRRLIVVGRLGERDNFINSALVKAATATPMPLRSALSPQTGLPWSHELAKLISGKHVYTRPLRAGRAVRTIDEPYSTLTRTSGEKPSALFRERYQPHERDSAPLDQASVMNLRFLTRVQGFPANWKWVSNNQRRIMVMLANAVPPPAATIIGNVIYSRHLGFTSPEVEGTFRQWLVRGGRRSRATSYNIISNLRRARNFLGGRTFADPALELATLEATPDFANLATGTRSDLRQALLHYVDYLEDRHRRRGGSGSLAIRPVVLQRPPRFDLAASMAGVKVGKSLTSP